MYGVLVATLKRRKKVEKRKSSWMDLMQNPKGIALKKFMFEALQENYTLHEDVIERISHHLVTDKDLSEFTNMINKVYESGYRRAVADYKEELSQLGIEVKVKN